MPELQEIAETSQRLSPGAMDDLFCEHYLNNGGDRCAAYRSACKDIDKEYNSKYVAQYAKSMYDRLATKISDMLDKAEIEDATLARNVLRAILLKEDASDTAKIAAAKELQRKRADKIEISKPDDIDEIEAKIIQLEKELNPLPIEGECQVIEDDSDS